MPSDTIDIHLDRDSVAMGDDAQSHAGVTTIPSGTMLSAAIERCSPEIRSRGWSWVAVVDREVSAVWSVDHGVQLLVPDRALTEGPVEIFFRYFTQIDPAWLFDRLSEGARANQRELQAEYAPIAREKYRAELRRREREIAAKYLSDECIDALRHYGADITLHADMACDFTAAGEEWAVRRADTMFQVFHGGGGSIASIRPRALGEAWLVGMLGSAARISAGLTELPDAERRAELDFTQRFGMWSSRGPNTVQVHSENAVHVAQFVVGRSIAEIRMVLDV